MSERKERGDRHGDFRFRPGEMPPLFGDTAALLIVDDDHHVANILSLALEPEGYVCTVAANGPEARARLAEKDYAVALVDVMMPGESGLELVEDLIGKHPDLAVVMVTGVDDPNIADLALASGAYGYIVKPFRTTEMVITVANAGRRRCLEIERRAQRERVERLLADRTAELGDALEQLSQTNDDP
jgi:DNA-binding NtrC family response regulator